MCKDFAIWLLPAPPQGDRLAVTIASIAGSSGSPLFAPHVTVHDDLPPEPHRLADIASSQASITAPVHVRIQGVEQSNEYFRVLYLKLWSGVALRRVRDDLGARLGLRRGLEWDPHVSLAYGPIRHELTNDVRRSVAVERTLNLDRLAVMAAPGGWRDVASWRIVSEHVLQGNGTLS